MKNLIICNCATGLEIFRGMLIQELAKEGKSVYAIVPKLDDKKEKDAEERIKKMHCKLIRIPMERRGMNPLKDIALMKAYYKVVRKIQPDLVITYTIKPNIYGGMVCRVLKIPYVVNITGLGTAFQRNGILKQLVINMYKVALKKVKIAFFENVENREIFIKENILLREKTHVLAGAGVDLERFKYTEYPKDNDTIRFLFIGRVMKEKGIDELFQAMRKLNKNSYKCSLDVVGGFEENYIDEIKKYEEEGWLHYQGYQNDVRPLIEKCHCFVLPSWHEGMANTNLECAASGRPVITSNIHGCLEAVIDEKTGYLAEKKSADDLYKIMKKFIQLSYKERKEMGLAGRRHMEAVFDKRIVVKDTINELLKNR